MRSLKEHPADALGVSKRPAVPAKLSGAKQSGGRSAWAEAQKTPTTGSHKASAKRQIDHDGGGDINMKAATHNTPGFSADLSRQALKAVFPVPRVGLGWPQTRLRSGLKSENLRFFIPSFRTQPKEENLRFFIPSFRTQTKGGKRYGFPPLDTSFPFGILGYSLANRCERY